MTPILTVSEAASVLASLGRNLTERQIRYLGLEPSRRWPGQNGGRLFDVVDVTLLAVFADLLSRCHKWELPIWSARAALSYREADLRRAITRRSPRFLLVDPAKGTATLADIAGDASAYAIDIRVLAARVSAAARAYRRNEPEIWTGAEWHTVRELVASA